MHKAHLYYILRLGNVKDNVAVTGCMRQPQAAAVALGAFMRCRRAHVPLAQVAAQAHKKQRKQEKTKTQRYGSGVFWAGRRCVKKEKE